MTGPLSFTHSPSLAPSFLALEGSLSPSSRPTITAEAVLAVFVTLARQSSMGEGPSGVRARLSGCVERRVGEVTVGGGAQRCYCAAN